MQIFNLLLTQQHDQNGNFEKTVLLKSIWQNYNLSQYFKIWIVIGNETIIYLDQSMISTFFSVLWSLQLLFFSPFVSKDAYGYIFISFSIFNFWFVLFHCFVCFAFFTVCPVLKMLWAVQGIGEKNKRRMTTFRANFQMSLDKVDNTGSKHLK